MTVILSIDLLIFNFMFTFDCIILQQHKNIMPINIVMIKIPSEFILIKNELSFLYASYLFEVSFDSPILNILNILSIKCGGIILNVAKLYKLFKNILDIGV